MTYQDISVKKYSITEMSLPADLIWEFQADKNLFVPATIHADIAIYFRTTDQIYAIEPNRGEIIWQRQIATSDSIRPLTKDLYVYFVNKSEDKIEVLHGLTGETVWALDPSRFTKPRTGKSLVRFMAMDGQFLYLVVNLLRGTDILKLNPQTGEVIGQAPTILSDELASPRALYVGNDWLVVETTVTWVLTKDLNQILLKLPDITLTHQAPTFVDEVLYTSGEFVKAIKLPTYTTLWEFEDQCQQAWDQVPDSPKIDGDSLYLFASCGIIYKLDAQDGQILWEFHAPPSDNIRTFELAQGIGYSVSNTASIRGIDLESGLEVGRLEMAPPVTAKQAWDYLEIDKDLMILTYGNHQAFAFRVR